MANVIEIIIRAKDEAGAAVKKAADSFKELSGSTELFSKSSDKMVEKFERLVPAMGAVTQPIRAFRDAMDGASASPEKLARGLEIVERLGIASGSGLLALQRGAKEAGVAVEVLQLGLTNFRARIIAAQNAAGPGYEALKKLGFSAEEIKAGFGGASQALQAVIPRILGIKDAGEKAAVATTFLGKGSSQLIPVFQGVATSSGAAATGMTAMLGVLLPLAAAIAAVTAAAFVLKASLDSAIEGGKIARELDVLASRVGAPVEEFSKLAFAAEQVGASAQTVETAIKLMSKNLYDAQRGVEAAKLGFVALGLSAEKLGQMTPTEAFRTIIDALSKVRNESDRTGVAIRIFGTGVDKLGPLLAGGVAGLDAAGNRLDYFGRVVTETSAKVSRDFSRAALDFRVAQEGMNLALADGLLPALTRVAEFSAGAVAGLTRLIREINDTSKALGELADAGLRLSGFTLDGVTKGILQFSVNLAKSIPVLREMVGLLQFLERFKPPKAIEPEKSGPLFQDVSTTTLGPDVQGGLARYQAQLDAQKKANAEAKKSAAEALKAQEAFRAALDSSYLVSEKLGLSLKAALGPDVAAKFIDLLQSRLATIAETPVEIRGVVTVELIKPPKETNPLVTGKQFFGAPNGAIDGGQLGFGSDALEEARAMEDVANAIGVSVEHLIDSLHEAGAQFGEFSGSVFVFGEALKDAFNRAFDPMTVAIRDANKAVIDLTGAVGGALADAFEDITKNSASFQDALVGALEKIRDAVIQLIGQLVLAIAKMKILNALKGGGGGPLGFVGSFFLSAGGEVPGAVRGGSVAALAGGGSIRGAVPTLGLAQGGAMVHAANGLRVVPGSPQAFDSVPAMLAPGEVVLPTIGGRMPGDVLAGLTQLGKDVSVMMARSFVPQMQPSFAGASAGNTYNVSTIDADGFRSFLRGGAMARESGLASDPARDS